MKKPDWRLHFDGFINSRLRSPFAWGSNDCATFAADCVLAITGKDLATPGLRGHKTAKQASRTLLRYGGLTGIASAALGSPTPVSQAEEGDVMLVKTGKRIALGICNAQGGVWGPSANGLVSMPMSEAVSCWKVA